MSYKALYRKYRPLEFHGVMGQDHIVKTLENIIKTDKIGHAYLFAGPRGTGKTTVAHVFAKEVNRNAADVISVDDLDVIEIDAASNNGVAEIRSVIENSRYAPSKSKYKVYIIDEVHMLTKGAFNALLKTLEEPPKHVIFILATTEPHKIPVTILSRTQRFNFRRIHDEVIIEQLKTVLEQEEISFDSDAIRFIAKLAQGGMRDALSIADQAAAFGSGNISFVGISQVFGIISISNQIRLLNLAYEGKAKDLLTLTNEFLENGADIERLTASLLDILKDFIFYNKTQDTSLLDFIDADEVDSLKLTIGFAYEGVEVLMKLLSDLRFTQVPKQAFELALLKMTKDIAHETTVDSKPTEKKNLFETSELNIPSTIKETPKRIEDTDEIMTQTDNVVTSELEVQYEKQSIDEDILSTQEIPLNELGELEQEETQEIDIMSMFSKEATNEMDTLGLSNISTDFIINQLVQVNKEKTTEIKNWLSEVSRFAIDGHSSTFVELLEKTSLIGSGDGFVLLTSEDKTVVNEINSDNKDQNFIDFIAKVFKEPLLVTAITKETFEDVKETYVRMMKDKTLPKGTPVEKLHISTAKKTEEEEFGAKLFGDLFNA